MKYAMPVASTAHKSSPLTGIALGPLHISFKYLEPSLLTDVYFDPH